MTSSAQAMQRAGGANGQAAAARRRQATKPQGFREVAAPVLGTVGLLLLIPAIWATLLLGGVDVPGAKRTDAGRMAFVMLMCWPVAICLIAASAHFFIQIMRAKKQALDAMREAIGSGVGSGIGSGVGSGVQSGIGSGIGAGIRPRAGVRARPAPRRRR